MSAAVTVEHAVGAIDPAALLAAFAASASGAGAIASFTGLARPTAQDGAALTALILESHATLTLASMQAIAQDAANRFALTHLLVTHRHGPIAPGEAIVFVAAAAAHRRAAFDAVDYAMDRLKTEAIFWKREDSKTGSQWIEPTNADHAAAAAWEKL